MGSCSAALDGSVVAGEFAELRSSVWWSGVFMSAVVEGLWRCLRTNEARTMLPTSDRMRMATRRFMLAVSVFRREGSIKMFRLF